VSASNAALEAIARQFVPHAPVLEVRGHGSGFVNDTYLATFDGAAPVILQRINTHVFKQPARIMANMRTLSEHVEARLAREPLDHRWVLPRVYAAADGRDYYVDAQGGFWRAIGYVERSRCYQTVQGIAHAREAGYALGLFHYLISDLDPGRLYDTLPGFHITPRYLEHYDRVLKTDHPGGDEVELGLRFVEQRRDRASVLEDALARGELRVRPIHGDPKINNFMLDEDSGRAVSLIDLDTVKPGLVHYDIGDCLRSCCNAQGEEGIHLDEVFFDLDLCRAILEGYLSVAAGFLDAHDVAYIYESARLIAFELGLRFFTDHLEGNVYFKVQHPRQNLRRALGQFKLVESIEAQEADIRAIVAGLTDGA
jgi:hypothetical protein